MILPASVVAGHPLERHRAAGPVLVRRRLLGRRGGLADDHGSAGAKER